ncbi:hotdog fold thioesterase [Polyangium jinanense]|uniref:Medium/long-chain acyl-CoA thioesterase YigI n=1 Tax=Polyangium jinanense TaxID=2829994 RepID=A0A9X3X9U9_9BACT|nr:hotdog fold thioesterase [Polyangium jinanense]MDC3955734.1 hotdog fold thioesterase [Polyangium jinanense]MDC3986709.1 hotdog fold thioesterase [Polyangium jinanense]
MLDLDVFRQLAEELIPFNKWIGVKVDHLARGHVTLSIPWRDELIGDPVRQAIHGGVISMLADTAGGLCVWTAIENPALGRVSTVDLRVDYLRPGRRETLVGDATTVRVGAKLGWADIRLYHPSDASELVATARGVYALKNPKQPRDA